MDRGAHLVVTVAETLRFSSDECSQSGNAIEIRVILSVFFSVLTCEEGIVKTEHGLYVWLHARSGENNSLTLIFKSEIMSSVVCDSLLKVAVCDIQKDLLTRMHLIYIAMSLEVYEDHQNHLHTPQVGHGEIVHVVYTVSIKEAKTCHGASDGGVSRQVSRCRICNLTARCR